MYCLISSSVIWDPFDFATKATGTSPADSSFILNHYKHVFIMADQDSTPRVKDCAQNKEENNADLGFFLNCIFSKWVQNSTTIDVLSNCILDTVKFSESVA